jgi:hypothetical protein
MYESFIDRQIREAMERGEFDDLPGAGKPIPGAGRPHEPNWWVKSFVERERSDERRRADYERIEARVGTLWALGSEQAVRAAVARLNDEIAHLNDGDDRFEPFDPESVVTAWKAMARARTNRGR